MFTRYFRIINCTLERKSSFTVHAVHTAYTMHTGRPMFLLLRFQVMVDGVMAPVKGANCSEDVDKILINLTSATPEQTPLQPVATQLNALPDNIRLILADHSYSVPDGVFSHQEHNVMVYVAGYMARELQNKVCDPCRHLLSGSLDSHGFLEKKLYKETTVGLTVPSTLLVDALTGVEAVYRRVVKKVVVYSDVDLSRLSCEQCHME